MSTPQPTAVIPADAVLDGELIEDNQRPGDQHEQDRRALSWWQRSPRVPVALKSRANAAQAGKDAAVAMVRAP